LGPRFPSYQVGGGEPGYIAPDPKDIDVFFAGTNNGGFMTYYNRKTGQLREVNPYPRQYQGEPSSEVKERWQWTYPIIFSPVDANVLYTSSQRVWKTTNGGQSWEPISPDLSRHDPKTMGPSGGPITHDMNWPEIYAVVFSLAPGKRNVNVIWAGTDDGLVHVTRDGGRTWTNVTPRDMPEFGRVSQIDASAFNDGSAYVAVKRPLLDDTAPYIFRTHDFGQTWTKITSGILPNDYVHTVREDHRRGLLYAGTRLVSTSPTRRRHVGIAVAQPAARPGQRPDRREERARAGHSRSKLLRAGQHRAAAPGDARHLGLARPVSLQARRRDPLGWRGADPVLAQATGAEPDD
jgi:hypothetical protein